MKSSNKKNFRYWLRIIHRDLGYLMAGICLIYATSGFLLSSMNRNDQSYQTIEETVTLKKGLDEKALTAEWNKDSDLPALKRILPADDSHMKMMIEGGLGIYSVEEGTVEYEINKKRPVLYWANRLHYNRVKGWDVMGTIFALSLAFFAISGLFMLKGKNGFAGRGKWFLLAGILIPLAFIFFA